MQYQKQNKNTQPRQDSNLESPDPKSDALYIRPRGRDAMHSNIQILLVDEVMKSPIKWKNLSLLVKILSPISNIKRIRCCFARITISVLFRRFCCLNILVLVDESNLFKCSCQTIWHVLQIKCVCNEFGCTNTKWCCRVDC